MNPRSISWRCQKVWGTIEWINSVSVHITNTEVESSNFSDTTLSTGFRVHLYYSESKRESDFFL